MSIILTQKFASISSIIHWSTNHRTPIKITKKKQTGMTVTANDFQSNHQDFPQSLISKKRVQFSTISSLYTYQDCQDNLGDSSRCRWYSVEDYQRFKQEAKQDRISCLQKKKRKSNGDDIGDDTVCPFGLELHQESIGRACRPSRTRASDQWKLHLQARENCCCIKAAFRVGSNTSSCSRCFPSH